MKKMFLLSIVFVGILNMYAQKGSTAFEGTITYTITTQGELDPQTKAQMPSEVVWTYKGAKSSMLMKTAFGNINVIANADTKEQIVLYDMMGQKMAIKSSKEETEAALKDIPEVKVVETNETKKIAGYNCKKIEISDGKTTTNVYVTNDINIPNANWNGQYKNVQGVLMEYSQKANPDGDAQIIFTAKEVKKAKIKDNAFEIPADYKQMSMTEFKQMFGGGEE
ncbi:MAG: DUF4412 domain-containing protein [Bacteroidales bacterium]|nr:DUF4412 domain-containing protein [Bacteroidales bacterium]